MPLDALKSEAMTPIKNVLNWECRHCKHKWPIADRRGIDNPEFRPKQCPNRPCRAMDWDREKIKIGRPSKKPKQPGRPKGRGKKKRG